MTTIFGIFLILHGLVHLIYAGHSLRFFELSPGFLWPDGSWVLSRLTGGDTTRTLAGILLVLAALLLIAGGLGLVLRLDWWRSVAVAAAAFSAVLYVLLWNGSFKALDVQGGVGVLINLAVVVLVRIVKWPL